ncbi:MAG: histidine-type phosphatase [Prevotella sp.]
MRLLHAIPSLTLFFCPLTLHAQTLTDDAYTTFSSWPSLSASNYTAYDNLYAATPHTMTPPPDGYEPFYMSTYARHGSRWLINPKHYDMPIKTLEKLREDGGLTDTGTTLLADLKRLRSLSPDEKLGVLTPLGFEQHNGIARRMCERFPEIFNKTAYIHARSSYVPRCVKSMAEEAEVIERMADVWVVTEAGKREWQDYLAHPSLPRQIKDSLKHGDKIYKEYKKRYIHPQRLMSLLVVHPGRVPAETQADFMVRLFDLASNMQSHKPSDGYDMNLSQYFSPEERYDLWRLQNVKWYLSYAAAPQTGGIAPWRQKWLLDDFVLAADSLVGKDGFHGATLRFGHEACLMPLVALMEAGNAGVQVASLDTLDHAWRNYEIFPMASNIQLVFYRDKRGGRDILVKALLNEREVSLPAEPVRYPYYRWEDLRRYWISKMRRYDF